MEHTDGPPDATLLERCPCGCSIYRSEEEPALFLERCLLHDSAPNLLQVCQFWLGAVQNSLALRLALTSLPEGAGPALIEMLQEAIEKAEGE